MEYTHLVWDRQKGELEGPRLLQGFSVIMESHGKPTQIAAALAEQVKSRWKQLRDATPDDFLRHEMDLPPEFAQDAPADAPTGETSPEVVPTQPAGSQAADRPTLNSQEMPADGVTREATLTAATFGPGEQIQPADVPPAAPAEHPAE